MLSWLCIAARRRQCIAARHIMASFKLLRNSTRLIDQECFLFGDKAFLVLQATHLAVTCESRFALWDEVVSSVAVSHVHHVTKVTKVWNVFLKDDFHFDLQSDLRTV